MKKVVGLLFLFVFAACVMMTMASPAVGVTPTLIGRGTYDPFKVKSDPGSLVEFDAKAKSPVDIVVRTHDYAPEAQPDGIRTPDRSSSPSFKARSRSTRSTIRPAHPPSCPPVKGMSTPGVGIRAKLDRGGRQGRDCDHRSLWGFRLRRARGPGPFCPF